MQTPHPLSVARASLIVDASAAHVRHRRSCLLPPLVFVRLIRSSRRMNSFHHRLRRTSSLRRGSCHVCSSSPSSQTSLCRPRRVCSLHRHRSTRAELMNQQDMEELMNLPPEKILLRWMNFHLKKAGYKKIVTNFSSDVKNAEVYAHPLNVFTPEYRNPSTLTV